VQFDGGYISKVANHDGPPHKTAWTERLFLISTQQQFYTGRSKVMGRCDRTHLSSLPLQTRQYSAAFHAGDRKPNDLEKKTRCVIALGPFMPNFAALKPDPDHKTRRTYSLRGRRLTL
jgi:hypothetical protein